jgi:hypothetical protein
MNLITAVLVAQISAPLIPTNNCEEAIDKSIFGKNFQEVARAYRVYDKSFEKFISKEEAGWQKKYEATGGTELRATLATLANLLRHLKIIGSSEFEMVMDRLVDANTTSQVMREIANDLLKAFTMCNT